MYKLYENNNFTIGTPLMVLTDDGILSFEIENISVFNSFMEDILSVSDGESIDDKLDKFQDEFHNKIIGVPEGSSINDQIYFNKAIEFFLQKGLKIFHTFDIEGSGIWESAKITNGKLSFINCYDNY